MGDTIVYIYIYSSQHCLPVSGGVLDACGHRPREDAIQGIGDYWKVAYGGKNEIGICTVSWFNICYIYIYWLWMPTFKHITRWKPFLVELKIPLIYIYIFCFICSCTYGEYTVFPLMSLMPRQSVKAIVAYCRRFPQALVRLVDVETCELIFQC